MAKVLKTVAVVAGVVALVAATAATFGGVAGLTAATLMTIATVASVVATAASMGAQLMTKPPPARGSETRIQIGVELPSPYLIGEVYSAGVLRHDTGYGATLKKVPNPYRGMVVVYSVAGALTACTPQVDFAPIGGYYTGFLYTDTQLGETPEASALTPHFAGMPGWDASSKLSGNAAILWNLKFDKEGKVFASGVPAIGAVWQGVKVYDPREDSTYPGGSGTQRIDDETTWAYSDTPALHAIAYAYGRFQNGVKVFGIGQPVEGIDLPRFVAWANTCEANGWSVAGTIYEPGDKWENLKHIMEAGCAEPVLTGGILSVRFNAPQVSLATITEDDFADDDFAVVAMQTYRARLNGMIPKYRSADHNWEFVSADKVTVESLVTEDGEDKTLERQWQLVKDVDQVTHLATYAIMDSRELGPFELTLKPQWRSYKPGECLTLEAPSLDFTGDVIILQREIDPGSMKVKLTCVGETAGKHAFALGQVGVPPPSPALGQTAEERDEIAAAATMPAGFDRALITTSRQSFVDIAATDTTVTIDNHSRIYDDQTVSVTGATLSTLDPETAYYLYYDDATRAGGAVTWEITTDFFTAQNSDANPDRHYGGFIVTDVTGGTGNTGAGSIPGGTSAGDPYPRVIEFDGGGAEEP